MSRAAASLLLVHIMLVCPMALTPVTSMTRGQADTVPKPAGPTPSTALEQQIQSQLEANKDRVMKILEGREWYRAFLELLRHELKKKSDHRIEVANIYMGLAEPPRTRRSVADADRDLFETLAGPLLRRAARSVPAHQESRVEVSAALKVDGKLCLNVTKQAGSIRMGDSNEIIKADIGNTEILLSMKVTKKGADDASELPQPPPPPPPPSPPSHRASGDALAAERTRPSRQPTISPTAKPTSTGPVAPPPQPPHRSPTDVVYDATAAAAAAAVAESNSAQGNASRPGSGEQSSTGDFSKLQTRCTDRNYCLFGGTCVYYSIIDLPLCNCRKGYKGNRCELYDINEVLSTLDSAHKRRVIGNGPIVQQGDHMDVLSVVESTAIYLLHIPKSYPSPQAMQLLQNLLMH